MLKRKMVLILTFVVMLMSVSIVLTPTNVAQATETTALGTSYNIEVDAGVPQGAWSRFYESAVNTDYPRTIINSSYGRNIQNALQKGHVEAGFQLVRTFGIFGKDIGIYTEPNGVPTYDFTISDQIFDAIRAKGMYPMVGLSFTPEALATGTETVGWYNNNPANITPPTDYTKWRNLVKELIQHLIARYGAEEIRTKWYFEVYNEPDFWMFFNGTQEEYFKLYDYAVEGVKDADPQVRVGGPVSSGFSPEYIDAFLNHITNGTNYATGAIGTKCDFIDYHNYSDDSSVNGILSSPAKMIEYNNLVAGYLDDYNFTGPLFLTEWGTTAAMIPEQSDDESVASFVAKTVHLFADDAAIIPPVFAFYELTGIFEGVNMDNKTAFGGYYGLMLRGDLNIPASFDVSKPAFHSFNLLHRMGSERISLTGGTSGNGINGVATMSDDNKSVQILLYNHVDGATADSAQIDTVNLTVDNLPFAPGSVKIEQYTIDRTHSNAYRAWEGIGSPATPTADQWEVLKQAAQLYGEPVSITNLSGDSVSRRFTLNTYGVTLLVISENESFSGTVLPATVEAEVYGDMSGVQIETSSEGGQNITSIDTDDWMDYQVVVPVTGNYALQYRVASPYDTGLIQMRKRDGTILATTHVPDTGGWQTYQTLSTTVNLTAGTYPLQLFAAAGGWNINWMKLTASDKSALSRLEAEDADYQFGMMNGVGNEDEQYMSWIDPDDYLVFNNVDFGTGLAAFQARVASGGAGGNIELRLDNPNGELIGSVAVGPTEGWQTWKTATADLLSDVTGVHTLYVKFTGGNSSLFNLDWLKFMPAVKIVNKNSGKVLEVPASSFDHGTVLEQRSYGGGANQKWYLVDVGNGYYNIQNVGNRKVVDVSSASTTDGASVIQWYEDGFQSQQWQLIDAGGGFISLMNQNSGKYLDIETASTADGAHALQWYGNGYDNQKWSIIAVEPQYRVDVNAYYQIVNRNSEKLLDIYGGSSEAGALALQWNENGGPTQQWQFVDAGSGYYNIVNRNSGKYLDIEVASTAAGKHALQWNNNGFLNQQWRIVDVGGGYFNLMNRNSGKMLDIEMASTAAGALALQWYNNGLTNQQWSFVKVAEVVDTDESYNIVNRNSGKNLDIEVASTAAGAHALQWTDNGLMNQQWQLVETGDGYYNIVNRNSGRLLDIEVASTAAGAYALQWNSNGLANQQWQIVTAGGGYVVLINRNSGKFLDIYGGSTAAGANVLQWNYNGGATQQWSLNSVN